MQVVATPDPLEDANAESGLAAAYLEHRPALLRFLTARTRDPSEAEEILQDLWFRIRGGASGPVANPQAYLHRSALNLANDRSRARGHRVRREAEWVEVSTSRSGSGEAIEDYPSAEAALDARRETAKVVSAVALMPDGAARVFRLHKLEGLSHGEVAATLGISKSAVEKHMAVALRHLLRALGREAGGDR